MLVFEVYWPFKVQNTKATNLTAFLYSNYVNFQAFNCMHCELFVSECLYYSG